MYPQMANIPLQDLGRRALTVGAISGPHTKTGGLLWHHLTSHGFTYMAGKKHSGKADQLTLASGRSEHM